MTNTTITAILAIVVVALGISQVMTARGLAEIQTSVTELSATSTALTNALGAVVRISSEAGVVIDNGEGGVIGNPYLRRMLEREMQLPVSAPVTGE